MHVHTWLAAPQPAMAPPWFVCQHSQTDGAAAVCLPADVPTAPRRGLFADSAAAATHGAWADRGADKINACLLIYILCVRVSLDLVIDHIASLHRYLLDAISTANDAFHTKISCQKIHLGSNRSATLRCYQHVDSFSI